MMMGINRNLAATTQTFTIVEEPCPANAEFDSASASVPANLTGIKVTLTSSQWSNPALAGKLVLWGVAYSTNNGVTWGPGFCDNLSSNLIGGASVNVPAWAYQTDKVGGLARNGSLPYFAFSGGDMPPVGTLVRLFAWSQVAIPLGATVAVTSG